MGHRDPAGDPSQREYCVKWKDWPSSSNTWEPIANVTHCQALVDQYERKMGKVTPKNDKAKQGSKAKRKGKGKTKAARTVVADSGSDGDAQLSTKRSRRKSKTKKKTSDIS